MELELLQLLAPDLPSNKQVNLTWNSTTLGHQMSLPFGEYIWAKVKLTQRCNSVTLGHKMSLPGEGTSDQRSTQPKASSGGYTWPQVNLTEVVTHLARRCPLGVHLTRGQPDWSSNTLGHKMSLWGYVWPKVSLTQKSDKNFNLTWNHTMGGTSS